ncbi:hypothetical protein I317_06303 [Kwoniella heveanensis CBS 569]|nr:hypothetical protein I317_06303 [Kwoniella heveanensis CBS 569]
MLVQQHLSPLRAALNAKVRAGVRPIGRSARSLKSNAFSTSTSMRTKTQTQTQQRFLIGAGIALAVPTYLYLNRAHLDSDAQPDKVHSDVPDKVHSTQDGKTGAVAGVKKISSKEILDKKDGEEVWVVIEGEVYE